MRGPKPAQAVWCPRSLDPRQGIVHIDARRGRRNALVESTEPWPVYCCHDEILEADGTLGDFNWIDMGVPQGRGRLLAMLPYDGPRWYSRQATQFLLRHSLQVPWDAIKYTYSARAHLPADFFLAPIKEIQRTLPELAKQAINSLLGLWGIDAHYSWMVATQESEYLTLPHEDKVLIRPAPGGMKDICYRQELLGCSSMRPIVQQVLCREKTLLAELRCAL